MNKYLSDLIEISRFYGSNKDFVIAGANIFVAGSAIFKSANYAKTIAKMKANFA